MNIGTFDRFQKYFWIDSYFSFITSNLAMSKRALFRYVFYNNTKRKIIARGMVPFQLYY